MNSSKVAIVIPARYESSRFPGKPLAEINGVSMIERVYSQAKKSAKANYVIVATDDKRILDHVLGFGGKAVMTSADHQSGTDRIGEVYKKELGDFDIILNVQGDEPYISPAQIDLLISCFDDSDCEIATLIKEIKEQELIDDPNVVKVVRNKKEEAIYFSRAVIPFPRNSEMSKEYYQHVGIYAYRTSVLEKLIQLEQSKLELAEGLEQLRWLENGYKIKTAITNESSFSVDVPADIARIENIYKS